MKRILFALAIGAIALALLTALILPPRAVAAVPAPFPVTWPVVRGAYHVHSVRSDGTGTIDEIAAAANRAGLQFIVLTDHGNGTRVPDPPTYRSGVLCIDGVEISTELGHYAALNVKPSPFPLAGHPRDVIDDVRRLGGFGFAAHPGSPKDDLEWGDWSAQFDGLEWLNADSEWRDESWNSLARVLLTYAFRPVETLGAVLDRPAYVLGQWDRLTTRRRVAGIAAADAHARLGFRQATDPHEDGVLARVPSYDVSFGAFANHVLLNRALTGNAAEDAALVVDALREGRLFTSIDGFARLTAFHMRGTSGTAVALPGEYLDVQGTAALDASIAAPPGTRLSVVRDGQTLYEVRDPSLRIDVGSQPGAYRIEAHLPTQPAGSAPWVLSNPVYVGMRAIHGRAAAASSANPATVRSPIETWRWRPEASAGSHSELDATRLADGTPALEWRFALADGPRADQYAAMRFPVEGGLAAHDRLQLRVQGDAPRRLWVQLRVPGPGEGERWGATFYVATSLDAVELRFDDFRPLGRVSSAKPPLGRVDSLLLVVDTLNSVPGTTGRLAITDLWLAR